MTTLEKGLPVALDCERFVLGSILLDAAASFDVARDSLTPDDFSIEKHRRIFGRMIELHNRGEHIDCVTVANELGKYGELESCDGVTYLVSLDDGLPRIPNLESYVRIVLEKSTRRKAIFACDHVMNRFLSGVEDSAEILQDAERVIVSLGAKGKPGGAWVGPEEIVTQYPGGVQAFLQPPHGGTGIATPWTGVTDYIGGLQAGDLFVVAGRPSMGKTLAALQMAYWAARTGYGAAVFSLEMSKESLLRRLVCSVGRIDHEKLRLGLLNHDERRSANAALHELTTIPLKIYSAPVRTLTAMSSALRKLFAQIPHLRVVVVDHLQLMLGSHSRQDQRQQLSEISHGFKALAKELGITVLLLSQLNRLCEIENRQPQLSDLKETGSIEEDADVVMFIHRPERYARNAVREDLRGVAEFIIAKQREGPTGVRQMVFRGAQQRFESRAENCE